MFGGLNRLLLAALAVGAFFVAPTAAVAGGCGSGTSAVNVYKECLPSGGGGSHAGSGGGSGGTHTNGGTGGQSGGSGSTPISSSTAKVIKHAGKDGRALAVVFKSSPQGLLRSSPRESETAPDAVGSAFDLGSGPTALLIALAAAAVLLLGFSGMRGLRRSHRA